jgi:sialate O-acetylesterase
MPYFVVGLLILAFRVVHGNLVLPSYFSSSMVLQQNEEVEFWGVSSSPQKHITVTFDTKEFDTIADDNGKFEVVLPGRPASLTTYTITVQEKGENSTTTLHDIVFGEVYICSGQSNMQLGVSATFNQAEEIANSSTHGKGLRIMLVESAPEYYNISTPQENVSLSLPWGHPSPSRYTQKDGSEFVPVAGMSAVCYYYGVEMTKKNTSIPVGLIASSWGGAMVCRYCSECFVHPANNLHECHTRSSFAEPRNVTTLRTPPPAMTAFFIAG